MAYLDRRNDFRGRKARMGSLIVTPDRQLAFFITYCDCGCNAKIGLSTEEARIFAKRFYRESETFLQRAIASPGRFIRHTRGVIKEANRLVLAGREDQF